MKNHLVDLNDHLFAQIERLGDEELKGDELQREVNRAKAVTSVASQIISNASLAFNVEKAREEGLIGPGSRVIGIEDKSDA